MVVMVAVFRVAATIGVCITVAAAVAITAVAAGRPGVVVAALAVVKLLPDLSPTSGTLRRSEDRREFDVSGLHPLSDA